LFRFGFVVGLAAVGVLRKHENLKRRGGFGIFLPLEIYVGVSDEI